MSPTTKPEPTFEFVVMEINGVKHRVLYVNGNPAHMYSDQELIDLGISVKVIGK